MSCQKEIAKELGVSQATVSLALRGDRTISPAMRQKVNDTAQRMGYRPNIHWSDMMSAMRTGRKQSAKGVVGLLIEARSQKEWYEIPSYRFFHQSVHKRALEIGYRVEDFFLLEPGMSDEKIDRILQTRGIQGIILATPYHGNRTRKLTWERYAAIGIGFGWEKQELNRVVYDHLQNYITAFEELSRRGYKRIGTALASELIVGNRHGVKLYNGYLECQDRTPEADRIPIFSFTVSQPGNPLPEKAQKAALKKFGDWLVTWRPNALLVISAEDVKKQLNHLGLRVPQDIALADMALTPDSTLAGIDEKINVVGSAAAEMLAAQIAHNEFGLPSDPKTLMIEGTWVDGSTVKKKKKSS